MADLTVVAAPDHGETLRKLLEARSEAQAVRDLVLAGRLVRDFTNDELRTVADDMAIAETLMLRRLGLLASDEGYDGRPK